MSALGATGLSCLCIGAVIGALCMWQFYRRYSEWDAWEGYWTGFRRGRQQGRYDCLYVKGRKDEPRSQIVGRVAQGTDGLGGDESALGDVA